MPFVAYEYFKNIDSDILKHICYLLNVDGKSFTYLFERILVFTENKYMNFENLP